jgi:hypothetical protein
MDYDLQMTEAPAAKVRRMEQEHHRTIFKQLTTLKSNPLLVFNWFISASPAELKLGGAYGIHLLVSFGRIDLVGRAIATMGITCDNCDNPEIAILLVQYYAHVGLHELLSAVPMMARFVAQGIRKRIVDLFLEGAYRYEAWDLAKEVIQTYLCGTPYMAEASDLLPWESEKAPSALKTEVLSWFLHRELYLPADTPGTVYPPADRLLKIPFLPIMQPIIHEIYNKLPLKPQPPPLPEFEFESIKYVIDGANILFTGGEQMLKNIIRSLAPLGNVAVVIHCRHLKVKSKFLTDEPVLLVKTPYGINDDYYSIWLAMMSSAYLVTNDLFRDHVHQISPLIRSWRKHVAITFDPTSGQLIWPPAFSHCIQRIDDTFWLPTDDITKWKSIIVNNIKT